MRARTVNDAPSEGEPVYIGPMLHIGRGEAGGLADSGGSGTAGGAAVNATSAPGGADGSISSAWTAAGRTSSAD